MSNALAVQKPVFGGLVAVKEFDPELYAVTRGGVKHHVSEHGKEYERSRRKQEAHRRAINYRKRIDAVSEIERQKELEKEQQRREIDTKKPARQLIREAYTKERGIRLTPAQVAELNDEFPDNPQPVYNPKIKKRTVKSIVLAASRLYGIPPELIYADRRITSIVRARQFVMYHAVMKTLRSLPEIGRLLGGRDHTTVLHGYKKHAERHNLPRKDRGK